MEANKTLLVIAGATAVGKTAFAISAARQLHTEIISADSRQCYRELNIGVARPSARELELVKHHFIASHSIHEEVNAAGFDQYATSVANELFGRYDTVVMTGGTGLYIRAFCDGLDAIPSIDPLIRQQIQEQYNDLGLSWLQNEVAEKDPAFWQAAEQQNPQRLMRALEILTGTGKSVLEFRKGAAKQHPFRIVKIGLELPRPEMYHRINQRVDQMMAAGLVDEVRALLPYRQLNALQTVGYREIFEYLDGIVTLEQAVENIKRHTRQYAKRQLTWFKKDPDMRWFSATDEPSVVLESVFTT